MTDMTVLDVPPTAPPPPPPKKTNWKVIIPVVIVVILCCICLLVAGILAYMGTQGNGPLKMLAPATPTPTLRPTRIPTELPPPPSSGGDLVGDWNLYLDLGCTGSYQGPMPITFWGDNTFLVAVEDASSTGTWYISGADVELMFDNPPHAYLAGNLDSSQTYMEGIMSNDDGDSGCWYAEKGAAIVTQGGLEGDWLLYYDWGCTGSPPDPALITFNSDSTWSISGDTMGSWYLSEDTIVFSFNETPYSQYIGTYYADSNYMEGTMINDDGESGCWNASK